MGRSELKRASNVAEPHNHTCSAHSNCKESVLVTNTDICCLLVLLFQYGSDLLDFCFGLVGKMCLGIVLGMIGGGVGVFVTCARSMFGDHSELS
jgi:hypothetical protein